MTQTPSLLSPGRRRRPINSLRALRTLREVLTIWESGAGLIISREEREDREGVGQGALLRAAAVPDGEAERKATAIVCDDIDDIDEVDKSEVRFWPERLPLLNRSRSATSISIPGATPEGFTSAFADAFSHGLPALGTDRHRFIRVRLCCFTLPVANGKARCRHLLTKATCLGEFFAKNLHLPLYEAHGAANQHHQAICPCAGIRRIKPLGKFSSLRLGVNGRIVKDVFSRWHGIQSNVKDGARLGQSPWHSAGKGKPHFKIPQQLRQTTARNA